MNAPLILLPDHMRLKVAVDIINEDQLHSLPAPPWVVKGLIPAVSVGTVFGKPGSCKSFLGIDLLAHLQAPCEWHGFRIKREWHTVYMPFEGQAGIPRRVAAWTKRHGRKTGIRFIMHGLNLADPGARRDLVQALIQHGFRGGVLLLDTLAAAFPGVSENDSEGMGGIVIAAAKEISQALQCVVIIVHHTGKDEGRGMRGWSGLEGAVDFAIECRKVEKVGAHIGDREFVLSKVKDDATGRVVQFAVETIQLGEDEDGDEITSLAVVTRNALTGKQARTKDAETDALDDAFIWNWVKLQVQNGKYPSLNSLKGQVKEMNVEYPGIIAQRVMNSVHRLKAHSALATSPFKSPSGNDWLQAVDVGAPT